MAPVRREELDWAGRAEQNIYARPFLSMAALSAGDRRLSHLVHWCMALRKRDSDDGEETSEGRVIRYAPGTQQVVGVAARVPTTLRGPLVSIAGGFA
jgi:hypothetical protein